ncbi:MAG: hypothetical protein H8E46_05235, partial [FCB group bacterium]|nr:hypothetical protein [FCB group bacterium]
TMPVPPGVSLFAHFRGTADQQVPWIVKRTSTSTVRVKDGDSIVIAGLMATKASNLQYKVPFLGDLPYLGSLFRHTDKSIDKTDLVVQITPHILKEGYNTMEKSKEIMQVEEKYLSPAEETEGQ